MLDFTHSEQRSADRLHHTEIIYRYVEKFNERVRVGQFVPLHPYTKESHNNVVEELHNILPEEYSVFWGVDNEHVVHLYVAWTNEPIKTTEYVKIEYPHIKLPIGYW